jgi:hypothetical protein
VLARPRSSSSSFSSSASPMDASQSGPSANSGRRATRASSRPARWAAALDHGQSCGLAQRRARTGLRSTYLTAASRCRSSITKQWRRSCQRCPFQPSRKLIVRVSRRCASPSPSPKPSSSEGTVIRCTCNVKLQITNKVIRQYACTAQLYHSHTAATRSRKSSRWPSESKIASRPSPRLVRAYSAPGNSRRRGLAIASSVAQEDQEGRPRHAFASGVNTVPCGKEKRVVASPRSGKNVLLIEVS